MKQNIFYDMAAKTTIDDIVTYNPMKVVDKADAVMEEWPGKTMR